MGGRQGDDERQRILQRRALFVGASLCALGGCGTPPAAATTTQPVALIEPPAAPSETAAPAASAAGGAVSEPAELADAGTGAGARLAVPAGAAVEAPNAGPPAAGAADAGPVKVIVRACLTVIRTYVQFDRCSSRPRPESRPLIDEIAAVMARHPDIRAAVEGNTDPTEGACGPGLGQRRARQVKQQLASLGVDPARLCVEDWGDQRPLGPNTTADGRARNRRVGLRKLDPTEKCQP